MLKNKKILLIEPPFYRLYHPDSGLQQYPLALGYLSGAIVEKSDWDVLTYSSDYALNYTDINNDVDFFMNEGYRNYVSNLSDLNYTVWKEIENTILDYQPSVIGISCKTQNYKSTSNIAKIIKDIDPSIKVIIGGPHPTMAGKQILNNANIDIGVKGEGEETIIELLNALENGGSLKDINGIFYKDGDDIIETAPRVNMSDLDALPFPHQYAPRVLKDYDKYSIEAFHRIFTIRGCPYDCIFCGSKNIWTRKVRYRSTESIIKEIKSLKEKGIHHIHFDDDTFGVNKKHIKELCSKIIDEKINITFGCEIHGNLVDEDTIAIMKKAGCNAIQVGVESGNNEILEKIKKKITIEKLYKACDIIKAQGIHLSLFFIIGFPQEEEKHILDSKKLMETINCDLVVFNIFTPYPGTELFHYCVEMKLIDENTDFSLFNHQSPDNYFCPKIEKSRFQELAKSVAESVDRRNKELSKILILNPLETAFYSVYNIKLLNKKLSSLGFSESIKRAYNIISHKFRNV